jgi:nuclear pore complex protein Nup155
MGIFPEINRVWMTIDNRLYLWNYEMEGGDLINTFEDPDQIIVNVSLVKPIPGVFLDQIEVMVINLVFISCIYSIGNNSFGYCIFRSKKKS